MPKMEEHAAGKLNLESSLAPEATTNATSMAMKEPIPSPPIARNRWIALIGMLIPVAALLFALWAGRDWPVRFAPGFPQPFSNGKEMLHPVSGSAIFSVYSATPRKMESSLEVLIRNPIADPQLMVSVNQGKPVLFRLSAQGASGLYTAAFPLDLRAAANFIHLSVADPGAPSSAVQPFCVEMLKVSQSLFTAGNLGFCAALVSLVAASILAGRAFGTRGLDLFCSASLVGFLLITGTGTILSFLHALTGMIWLGATLLVSGVIAVVPWSRLRQSSPPPEPVSRLSVIELLVVLALVAPIFVFQIINPINKWDDLMYHGSRTAYWMQNASALPFVSHDDRLSVFPIGGDLVFAWGTMIAHAEMPGKFMVFLAYPLLLFSMLATLRNAGLRSSSSLAVVAVFATAPLVFTTTIGIKPDLWLVLLGLITLHWVLAARRKTGALSPGIVCILAAAAAGAAFGVKWTAAPLVLLAPFVLFKGDSWKKQLVLATGSFALALFFSGAGPILLSNLQTAHHPFGSRPMRELHQPEPGLHAKIVQLKRVPFLLSGIPLLPSEEVRRQIFGWEWAVANAIGASERLPKEGLGLWPGVFYPRHALVDGRFSLAWIFVFIGAVPAVFALRKTENREKHHLFWLAMSLSIVFGAAVVTQTRWQSSAGLPERFLLLSLALALLAVALMADRFLSRGPIFQALGGGLVVVHALPFFLFAGTSYDFANRWSWTAPANFRTNSELNEISQSLPPARKILLVGTQGSRDYPLFRGTEGFANRVTPWGKMSFDKARFSDLLEISKADTVIIESTGMIDMSWDPAIDARPFIHDMEARVDFRRVPVGDDLSVFVRK